MKKNYVIITLLILSQTLQAQIVNIPDANFKNTLINTLCVDTNGDGVFNADADTNNDNEVQISEAEAIIRLNLNSQSISDLTGIEKFVNIELLRCSYNNLTDLDFSQNLLLKDLYCDDNQLTVLDVSMNNELELLNCLVNNLTTLDVSNNPNLMILYCGFNQLTTLDVSNNPELMALFCYTNQLTTLNLRNGNNALLFSMFTQDNINLTCIEVDDSVASTSNTSWLKDTTASYSEDCGILGVNDIENEIQIICYPNPVDTNLNVSIPNTIKISSIKIYDSFGKLVMEKKSEFEKLNVSHLSKGLFIMVIETGVYSLIKKVIKK